MKTINITTKSELKYRIDMSFLSHFKDKTIAQIKNIKIYYGSRCLKVSDLFSVGGVPSKNIILKNPSTLMDNVGKKLTNNNLTIYGSVGNSAGTEMCSGELIIKGNVGEGCGAGIKGGNIFIYGNTGDKLCGSPNTSREGIVDGNIFISGSVGANSIQRMRRGIVFIGKNIGDNCCSNLISGTIIIKGKIGKYFMDNSKRGTVFVKDKKVIKNYRQANNAEYNFIPFMYKLLEDLYGKKILRDTCPKRYQGNNTDKLDFTEIYLMKN